MARRIRDVLEETGAEVWLDEQKISVGDSITGKIGKGLGDADFVLVLLTKNSCQSEWVSVEWQVKFQEEIRRKSSIILPLKMR